jgi:hypothetical protein
MVGALQFIAGPVIPPGMFQHFFVSTGSYCEELAFCAMDIDLGYPADGLLIENERINKRPVRNEPELLVRSATPFHDPKERVPVFRHG